MRSRAGIPVAFALAGAASALGLVVFAVVPPLLGIDFATRTSVGTYLAFLAVLYATLLSVVVGYLVTSGRGIAFLDVEPPSVRDLGYVVGGLAVDLLLILLLSELAFLLGVPDAPATVFERIERTNPATYLAFVPFALLVNAPLEEVLFRGIIQKRLYECVPRWGAVLVASLLFAGFHLPVFYPLGSPTGPQLAGIAAAAAFWFEGGLVFGAVYERTDNLVVPALVHGVGNALLSLLAYLTVA